MSNARFYKTEGFECGLVFQSLRNKARLRQQDIATMVGVSVNTIQYWEAGTTYPKAQALKKLIEIYLRFEVFAAGQELAEAEELWEKVRQEAPRLNAFFDHEWFKTQLASLTRSRQLNSDQKSELPPAPNNLPLRLTSFIGRKKELAILAGWLRPISNLPSIRLVTLSGAGGCGKTSLAFEVARELITSYQQGVWLVELAPLMTASGVVQALAATLNLKEQPGSSLLTIITAYLRDKQLLLVLDNCEHLVAECARVVDHLLRECPQLVVLATSREVLKVSGETIFRVPSLSVPSGNSLSDLQSNPSGDKRLAGTEDLMEYEAIELFVERGKSASSHFGLNEQNKAVVIELCRRLDGIPLALELAAARLRVLSVNELNERLADRFRLLKSGSDRTVLARHQTLRATVEWSYELLSQPERLLFRRLSVFAGGWTLEAAEEICGLDGFEAEETLDLLHELVNKSLVIVEEESEPPSVIDQPSRRQLRFKLLETLREYGWEQLAKAGQTEGDALQDRHLAFFANQAEQIAPRLSGKTAEAGFDLLEIERDNLRRALNWCLSDVSAANQLESETSSYNKLKTRTEAGLRLGAVLFEFWRAHSYFKEGREFLEKLKEQAEVLKLRPTVELVRVVNGAGGLAERQADFRRAKMLLQEGLTIATQIEDKKDLAYSLNSLGFLSQREGDYQLAKSYFEQSLNLARETDDKEVLAYNLNSLGNIAFIQGEHELARRYYHESMNIKNELGDKRGMGITLGNLGNLAYIEGDYRLAQRYYQEHFNIRREIGDKNGMAAALNSLATVAASLEDYNLAHSYFEQSLKIIRELGDKQNLGHTLNNLAYLANLQGNYSLAENCLQESLFITREIGDKREIGNALNHFGIGAVLQQKYQEARHYYRESLIIRLELGDKRGVGESLAGYCGLPLSQNESSSVLPPVKLEQACWLAGAASGLLVAIKAALDNPEKSLYQKTLETLHQHMSEEAFNTAFTAGQAMTLEEAVAYALNEIEEAIKS
jgi:predicted ATPase/transcriptional regulator with XRE-family HTH domain/Flp pilus assembly protein TadD